MQQGARGPRGQLAQVSAGAQLVELGSRPQRAERLALRTIEPVTHSMPAPEPYPDFREVRICHVQAFEQLQQKLLRRRK